MTTDGPLIMVVDDYPSMGQALRRLLTAAGFRVRVFDSAQALRARESTEEPDCLVLDIELPGQDGVAFYASLPAGRRPPAVFISAHDARTSRRRAMDAGACAFMPKPFDGAVFLDAINAAVDTGRRDRPPTVRR